MLLDSSDAIDAKSLSEKTLSLLRLAMSMLRISPQLRPSAEDVRRNMTFVTVKSLYYVARTRLRDYINHLQDQDERRPPLTKVWFETRRLDAWASVLEIGVDELMPKIFDMAVNSTEGNGRFVEQVLNEIKDTFYTPNFSKDQAGKTSLLAQPIAIEYYEERHEVLHQLVEKLWALLPSMYRRRIDHVWQQLSVETNDISMLKSSSEAIQPVNYTQYNQIGTVATMKALRLALYDQLRFTGEIGLLLPESNMEVDTAPKAQHQIGWYSINGGAEAGSQSTKSASPNRTHRLSKGPTKPIARREGRATGCFSRILAPKAKTVGFQSVRLFRLH